MTTAELPLAAARADGLVDPVAEELAVRQAGERVVQRLVLLRDRLAATAVDGEDRQEEQQDRRQREVGGEDDDRGEREHQPGGRGLKEQVAREVGEDREALDHRDHRRDDHRVEDEEDDRGQQDADQIAGDDVRLVRARETGRGLQDRAGGGDRDRVLQDVERDLLDRLAPDAVREQVGAREADERRERARASIVASAKQVEVVTSPSAPRVKTFSGTNSPTSAKTAKIATSGESRRRRSPAPVTPRPIAQKAPTVMTAAT